MKVNNRVAVNAQQALSVMSGIKLPIKTSLALARLSSELEKQVTACIKARDTLMKQYEIKVSLAKDEEDRVEFTTTIGGADTPEMQKIKEDAIVAFSDRINELMDSEGEDITVKVSFPDNIEVNSATLKYLLPFMDVV